MRTKCVWKRTKRKKENKTTLEIHFENKKKQMHVFEGEWLSRCSCSFCLGYNHSVVCSFVRLMHEFHSANKTS